MALLKIEYTLNNDVLGLYGAQGSVSLARNPGETPGHIYMKLLSYFMFFHDDLQIEVTANQHYKPDLVRLDERGDPLQWVDCGSTALRKLEKLVVKNKRTHIDIVKRTESELRSYRLQAEKRLDNLHERVRFFSFDDGFVDGLEPYLTSRHQVTATVMGEWEQLYLDVDGRSFETQIRRGGPFE